MTREEFIALPDMAAEIWRRSQQIQRLKSRLTSPKGLDTREKVQSSGSGSNMADVMVDMQADVDIMLSVYNSMIEEASELIDDKLKGYPELMLLTSLRYLKSRKWSEITAIMGYAPSTVFRMKDQALALLFNGEEL